MMMPRDMLFGFVRVPMWDYYWGLTAAQVDLLLTDRPVVVYKRDEERSAPWKNGTATKSYADKQYQRWLEKKKKREQDGRSVSPDALFANAKRIDFSHYLSSGEKDNI